MSRDHWALILRRGFGTFSMESIGPAAILPALIVLLGGDALSVGIMGSLMGAAGICQLISAWYLEGTPQRRRPLLIFTLAAALPFLGMAAAVFVGAASHPQMVIVALLAMVFLRNVAGALGNPADLDVSRLVVCEADRPRVFALRGLIADGMGLVAGLVTYFVLARYSLPGGFAIMAAIAFAAALCSWGAVHLLGNVSAQTYSRTHPWTFVRELFTMLRPGRMDPEARPFRRYVAFRHLMVVSRCAFPFLAVYAVNRYAVDASVVALFAIAMTLGRVVMGGILSLSGRRLSRGSQILQVGLVFAVLGLAAATWVPHWHGVLIAFAFQGCFGACLLAADPILMMECAPPDRAVRSMTLTMVACHPLGMVLPVVAGVLMTRVGFGVLAFGAAVAAIMGMAVLSSSWFRSARTDEASQTVLAAGD